jgi:hypothetical protein
MLQVKGGHDADELDELGLMPHHAYTVLGTAALPNGERLIWLRNPWGKYDWKGSWCDTDPRWTPELRAATPRPKGEQDSDDGSFFMTIRDFAKYFISVDVCDPWPMVKRDSTGDGHADTAELHSVRLSSDTIVTCTIPPSSNEQRVHISVLQRDPRGKLGSRREEHDRLRLAKVSFRMGGSWLWKTSKDLHTIDTTEIGSTTYFSLKRCCSGEVVVPAGVEQFQISGHCELIQSETPSP